MAETKLDMSNKTDTPDRKDRPEREKRPFRVRRTGGSGKVLFESFNEREAKQYVTNNFPRQHHEADDVDVYLQAPDGAKTSYTPDAEEEWGEYRTPQEREDD